MLCRLWQATVEGRPAPVVAGFDATTGRQLWTTAGRAAWRRLRAINAPVVSGGRAYVLAEEVGGVSVRLVCLDVGDGGVVSRKFQPEAVAEVAVRLSPGTMSPKTGSIFTAGERILVSVTATEN